MHRNSVINLQEWIKGKMPNTASRLYTILSKAQGGSPNHQTIHIWANALAVKPSLDEVAPLLVELLSQLDNVEHEIRDKFAEKKADTVLEHFPRLRKVIAFLDIHGQWAECRNQLSEAALFSLKMLIHDIDEEPEIAAADLEQIRNSVNELFDLLETADINKKLRDWIMNWLSMIIRAIDRYRISGARGLQEALFRIQGEADFLTPAFEKVKEQSPSAYQRLLDLFNSVCKVSDVADRCRKICESPVTGYIGSFVLRNIGVELPPSDGTPS